MVSSPRPGQLRDLDEAPVAAGVDSAAEIACQDGAVAACAAPVGYLPDGFVACAAGRRGCSGGQWSACSSAVPLSPDPRWGHEDVGCTWPPEACSAADDVRTCHRQLGSSGSVRNCTVMTEVCLGGVWTPCAVDED